MSAGKNKDRTGIHTAATLHLDDDYIYITNLSRQVSKACDDYFERTNGTKPMTMRDIITKSARRGCSIKRK